MSTLPLTGQTQAILAPGACDARVYKQQPKPCIVILIHGVNDLAGVYDDLETGICTGLNERLDHGLTKQGKPSTAALNPASYSSPQDDNGRAANPDAVYYRRRATKGKAGGHSRSVVIPFYWGFREEESAIKKDTDHGEWLDRFGNRLDKAGTKEGGNFANATTTLPDMYGRGFSGKALKFLPANALFGSPDHPLFQAPSRRYMVLAAQRLAMLVKIIRGYQSPDGRSGQDDTINVVGHSQGTLITLLANAMLHDEGQRPIDGFNIMSSPYSLEEALFERAELSEVQQTTQARLQTLSRIVGHIGSKPHTVPTLADMADACKDSCIGGLRWTGQQCQTSIDGKTVKFAERDNRGCVHLYFSPLDQTVGMRNVQGIGWQGVPDHISFTTSIHLESSSASNLPWEEPWETKSERTVQQPVLSSLGARFFQRIFTTRQRDGKGEEIGKPPSYRYTLLESGVPFFRETTWEGSDLGAARAMAANTGLSRGQSVTIQAPALPVTFLPDFVAGGSSLGRAGSRGIQPVWIDTDPIDASIAITNGGIQTLETRRITLPGKQSLTGSDLHRALEEQATDLNDPLRNPYQDRKNNAWAADWHRVADARSLGGGLYEAVFEESPNQARRRMMDAPAGSNEAISFHSAIPASSRHSRRALAYDLALGQACSIDDETFYAYLCRVADWRLDWRATYSAWGQQTNTAEDEVLVHYDADEEHKPLIDATCLYRSNQKPSEKKPTEGGGFLPQVTRHARLPSLVISQTVQDRQQGRPPLPGSEATYQP